MAHIEPSVKCMIKHERKIKKIGKKNMVLTSGNGGRWGGSFPHIWTIRLRINQKGNRKVKNKIKEKKMK